MGMFLGSPKPQISAEWVGFSDVIREVLAFRKVLGMFHINGRCDENPGRLNGANVYVGDNLCGSISGADTLCAT